MYGNTVITIGRKFGSGGHEIGKRLAKRLGIKFYDKELITMASEISGLSKDIFETHDEKPFNTFFYSLALGEHHGIGRAQPLNQKVFLAQFETIKKLAETESCVIVGRCADYALKDYKNTTKVFIYSDFIDRVRRVSTYDGISEEKASEKVIKADKKRANYYNYYSDTKWGDASSYDITINASRLGLDGAVELLAKYLELKDKGEDIGILED